MLRYEPSRDAELWNYLGAEAADALTLWQRATGRSWDASDPPWRATTGYTDARIVGLAVREGDEPWRNLVLKVCPAEAREPASHRRAWSGAAHPFVLRHLVRQPYDPWPMPGGLLMFQAPAHGGQPSRSLAMLPHAHLVEVCGRIAGGLVGDWNADRITRPPVSRRVEHFLRMEIGSAIGEHGSLRRWAAALDLVDGRPAWIGMPGEEAPLPNPVAMVLGRLPGAPTDVEILVGHAHLDLHLENVLLPASGTTDEFTLIDLATYRPDGPLTADPVSLMLSGVVSRLPDVSTPRWAEVRDGILDPTVAGGGEPPMDLIVAIDGAVTEVLAGSGGRCAEVWRTQYLLSVLSKALLFTTFSRLGPEVRWWLFRLAAHAADRVLGVDRRPGHAPVVPNPFVPADRAPALADEPSTVRSPRRAAVTDALSRVRRAGVGTSGAAEAEQGLAEAVRLAHWLGDTECPAAAVDAVAEVLAEWSHRAEPDDLLMLLLHHHLGVWSLRAGSREAALEHLGIAYRGRAGRLGRTHPDTRRSRDALGRAGSSG